MKLLLDQSLPRSTASLLRAEGLDAVHTGEIGLATATDAIILERSRQEDRVVVTLDADFHTLLALSGAEYPSVIRIRIQGLKAKDMMALILLVLSDWEETLLKGAALSVLSNRIRVHYLPLR